MKEYKIIEKDGTIKYYLNDKLHREDGPAVITAVGNKFYFIKGGQIFDEKRINKINTD